MSRYDLIVRGGDVATCAGVRAADIAVSDGTIVLIEPEIAGQAGTEIDATGQLVLPGGVDPHVHFNEPGRADWEGWDSGSRALVAGGTTTCIEMPLNAHPPTLDRVAFETKSAIAAATSYADFALWGGLTPDNLDRLPELAEAGAIGYKAFMSNSGMDDFRHAGDDTLYQGMQLAASVGLPVAVHAENDAITSDLARKARAAGQAGMRDYLASRPVIAETEAIGRAIALAEATGCALHVVHVSSGRGVALVAEARARGVDVTCETCPHYLAFDSDDAIRIGALAKCAPPLRDAGVRESLWRAVIAGEVDFVASDHSPAPPAMKQASDFFAIWGGISGCQHLLPAMLTFGEAHGLARQHIARLTATNAARRFQLPGKGELAVGLDADIAFVQRTEPEPLAREAVQYRHPASAWDDVRFGYRVTTCVLRGELVFSDGRIGRRPPLGRLIRISGRSW